MKQRIMEALLESNSNLSKEEIMWAASNLPDGKKQGEFKTHEKVSFDHEKTDLFESIGITEKETHKVAEAFAEATKNLLTEEDYGLSRGIEEVLNETADIKAFNALVVSKILRDSIDKIMEGDNALPKSLMNILKMMKKKDKDESED